MSELLNTSIQQLHDVIQGRVTPPFVLRTSKMSKLTNAISPLLHGGGGIAALGLMWSLSAMITDGLYQLGIAVLFGLGAMGCWALEFWGLQSDKPSDAQWSEIADAIKHIVTNHPEMADHIKPLVALMHDGSVNRFWCEHVAHALNQLQTALKEQSEQQQTLEQLNALFVNSDVRVEMEEAQHVDIGDGVQPMYRATKI